MIFTISFTSFADKKGLNKRYTAAVDEVEINGSSAKKLYFALEKNGAKIDQHSRRLTQYSLKNITCIGESLPNSDGSSTEDSDFSCFIKLQK